MRGPAYNFLGLGVEGEVSSCTCTKHKALEIRQVSPGP